MAIAQDLEALDLPTLVLWGDKDPFQKPDYAARLAGTIPGAQPEWIAARRTGSWRKSRRR